MSEEGDYSMLDFIKASGSKVANDLRKELRNIRSDNINDLVEHGKKILETVEANQPEGSGYE